MKRVLVVLGCLALLAIVSAGCFDDASVNPDLEEAMVSGRLAATWCWWIMPTVDPPPLPPGYTELTGKQAVISLVSETGETYACVTDDLSEFAMQVDTGMYTMLIDTWHTWPMRYPNIHVGRDTILTPWIALEYMSADTVICEFIYEEEADTLGGDAERSFIDDLNGSLGWPMFVDQARESFPVRPVGYVYRYYHVPIRADFKVWQVCDRAWMHLRWGSHHYPEQMNVAADWYFCLDHFAEFTLPAASQDR